MFGFWPLVEPCCKGTDLERGKLNILSATGRTPLHLAAATNQMAMVELLLDRGANAQLRNKDGITVASLASDNGHPMIAAAIKKWSREAKDPYTEVKPLLPRR